MGNYDAYIVMGTSVLVKCPRHHSLGVDMDQESGIDAQSLF